MQNNEYAINNFILRYAMFFRPNFWTDSRALCYHRPNQNQIQYKRLFHKAFPILFQQWKALRQSCKLYNCLMSDGHKYISLRLWGTVEWGTCVDDWNPAETICWNKILQWFDNNRDWDLLQSLIITEPNKQNYMRDRKRRTKWLDKN